MAVRSVGAGPLAGHGRRPGRPTCWLFLPITGRPWRPSCTLPKAGSPFTAVWPSAPSPARVRPSPGLARGPDAWMRLPGPGCWTSGRLIGAHLGGRPGTAPWAVVVDGQSVHPFPAYAIVFAHAASCRLAAPSAARRRCGRAGCFLYLLMHGLGTSIVWDMVGGGTLSRIDGQPMVRAGRCRCIPGDVGHHARSLHDLSTPSGPVGLRPPFSAAVVAVATCRRRWDRPESAGCSASRGLPDGGGSVALLSFPGARL